MCDSHSRVSRDSARRWSGNERSIVRSSPNDVCSKQREWRFAPPPSARRMLMMITSSRVSLSCCKSRCFMAVPRYQPTNLFAHRDKKRGDTYRLDVWCSLPISHKTSKQPTLHRSESQKNAVQYDAPNSGRRQQMRPTVVDVAERRRF